MTTPDETTEKTDPGGPKPVRKKRSRSRATVVLLLITLLGTVLFVGSIGVVAYVIANADRGEVTENSFLEVKLKGPILEAPLTGGLFVDPNQAPLLATEIARAILAAKDDERITGAYVTLDDPLMGWGSAAEIRNALYAFRQSGKPCVAYSESYTNGTWYVASACDEVVVAPSGVVAVLGLHSSIVYYKGLFEKIGVDAEMLHVGDYKSAIEPFERDAPSEAASEAMNLLLDGIYAHFIEATAAGRGVSAEEVRHWLDHPSLVPEEAVSRGMIDAVAFPDALRAHVHEVKTAENWVSLLSEPLAAEEEDEEEPSFTPLREYVKSQRSEESDAEAFVAVVYADGQIVSGEDEGSLFGNSGLLFDRSFAEWMEEVREDDAIKAVVLRVNSPGGSGLASDMMWHEVKRTQEQGKHVVVSMSDLAASGGYFISAPADFIVAQPTTITGSIGVFGGKLNFGGTLEKVGLTTHSYDRGEQADLFSATKGFGEDGTVTMQNYLDSFYWKFVGKVTDGRKMEKDAVHAIAQGRIWTGVQAKERGLVDEVGGLDVAIAKAAELAALEEYGIRHLPRQKSFFDLLLEDLEQETTLSVELGWPELADDEVRSLLALQRVLADDGVAALLPGRLTIAF